MAPNSKSMEMRMLSSSKKITTLDSSNTTMMKMTLSLGLFKIKINKLT